MRIKFISHAWVTITLALSSITLTTCSKEEVAPVEAIGENMEDNNENFMTKNQINIVIGNTSFSTILEENATAKEWSYLLPLTLEMHELNGNEKYHFLSFSLPTNTYNPDTIHAGDLMLYGNSCLVLFYKTFRTDYSYTKIGHIDNSIDLAHAVGNGNVTIRFDIQQSCGIGRK